MEARAKAHAVEARAKVDAEATAVRTQAEAVAEEVARTSPRDRDAVGFEVLDEVAGEREHRAGDRVLPQPRVPTLEAARHQIGERQRLGHAVPLGRRVLSAKLRAWGGRSGTSFEVLSFQPFPPKPRTARLCSLVRSARVNVTGVGVPTKT